jgi:hypothetical protein
LIRPRAATSVALALVALTLAACGGGDDEKATTTPAPSEAVEAPAETAPPASAPGRLPPEFVECMADQGFAIESSADIHSAPAELLQACFGSLHQGGGVP